MGLFDNSFTHWLGDRTGIHSLKPVAKIAATVGGGALGGPMGAGLGAGLFDFGDDLAHGKGIGQSLKDGALSGGLTYGGAKALGALKGAFAPSSAATVDPTLGGSITQSGIGSGPAIPYGAMGAADVSPGSGGALGALKGALGAAGDWTQRNPLPAGMIAQGVGKIISAPGENARNAAELEAERYMLERQKKLDASSEARSAAMAKLFASLAGHAPGIPVNPYGAGTNPYLGMG